MKKWFITGGLLALLILFIILRSVWAGFVYFAISVLMVICLYWTVLFILSYIEVYYKNFEADFKSYKANIINTTNMTSQEFEENLVFHIKNFKKSQRMSKAIDIFKILFIFTIFVVIIVVLFRV